MNKPITMIFFAITVVFFITGLYASNDGLPVPDEKMGFDINVLQNELQKSSITEDDTGVIQEKEKEKGNIVAVLIRILAYLLLVIILIIGISWIIKRIGIPGTMKNKGPGTMDLLEILPLSQNRTITMVRVQDVVYILGQNQGSMILIDKIEGQKAIELISSSKDGTSVVQFKDAINLFVEKFKKHP
jgi:flagellar biogenesis protein FliO